MRLVVGLGNPGADYELTRHNVGFLLVDLLAKEAGAPEIKRKDCRALLGRIEIENERVELVKPQTFMNLSGESISCLLAKNDYRDDKAKLIVISDDLALPFGKIRIRPRGSSGGHNGLKSIAAHLKTEEFIRLRIGIQAEHPISNTRNFVLERFSKQEQAELAEILKRSADAIRAVVRDGAEKAMAQFN
ncbi:MAG: aminoacyl-tRNA hydrolase [Acidobacteriota bacterium]|nr:aminoacyl-tRNA hydrolase [Acidobacteriota bacterium]